MISLPRRSLVATLLLVPISTSLLVQTSATPVAADPIRLTLDAAIRLASGTTSEVSEGRRDLSLAKSESLRSQVWLPSDPQVSFGAYHSTIKEDIFNEEGELIDRRGYGPNYTFSLSQEFEVAGQRSHRVEAASAGIERARLSLRFQKEALTASVRTAFLHALIEGEKVVAAEAALADLRGLETEIGVDAAQSEDSSQRLLWNQLKIQQAHARNQLASNQRLKAQALADLGRLCRISDSDQLQPVGTVETTSQEIASLAALRKRATESRLDLAALQKGLESAEASIVVKQRARIPNLTLSTSVSQFAGATLAGGEVSVPIPLFYGNVGDTEEATAERNQLARELDLTTNEVLREVSNAYADCMAAADTVRTFETDILPLHIENFRLQRRRQRREEADLTDIMSAMADIASTRQDLWNAVYEYNAALIELRRAVGTDITPASAGDAPSKPANP